MCIIESNTSENDFALTDPGAPRHAPSPTGPNSFVFTSIIFLFQPKSGVCAPPYKILCFCKTFWNIDIKFNTRQTSVILSYSGTDPGCDQGGGPDHDRPKLPTVHSSIVRAKRALFSMAAPRSSWVFSLLNMHSLHFGVPFYTIFEIIKY